MGTEPLLGQIVNSNVAFVGRDLPKRVSMLISRSPWETTPARLVETIRTAAARSDAVTLTGGIGPTQDDLTKEALCEVAGRRLRPIAPAVELHLVFAALVHLSSATGQVGRLSQSTIRRGDGSRVGRRTPRMDTRCSQTER